MGKNEKLQNQSAASDFVEKNDTNSENIELSVELTPQSRRIVSGLFSSVSEAELATSILPEYKE